MIKNVWGASEVEKAIEDIQAVIKNDGSDLESSWSELLEEPNFRGCIKVDFICLSYKEIFRFNIEYHLKIYAHLTFCVTFVQHEKVEKLSEPG